MKEQPQRTVHSTLEKFRIFLTNLIIIVLFCFFCLTFISKTEQRRLRPPAIHKEHSNQNVQLEFRSRSESTEHILPTWNPTIIIWWTMSYHKRDHFKDKTQKEYTCGKYQCVYTTNRSKLFESAAVLFTNGYAKQNDLPGNKLPGQRWVMVNHESPANGRFHSFLSGKINWTLTYHRSSDLLYPYGFYRRRGSDIHYPWEEKDLAKPLTVVTNFTTNYKDIVKMKKSKVMSLISNCGPKDRLRYIRNLSQHIEVDKFGKCLGQRLRDATKTRTYFKEHKFYLAFENSHCQDYITEKLWMALVHYMVPVVMGTSVENYRKLLPPNSFLHVDNFTGPEELASYLHYLDKDDNAYSAYHEWRATYDAVMTDQEFWVCKLCRMLNENSTRNVYTDLGKVWSKGVCTFPK